jgi:succinoglycan biosynthesis protein ExoM
MREQTGSSRVRVAICIGTFRRCELLRKLLIGISNLAFRKMPVPEITIIVADNDSTRSGEEVCATTQLPWSKKYVVEPQRGIAHVRNRAVREAGGVDFIAFLDDDEVPDSFWLDELLWIQSRFRADVVAGPVRNDFASDVPAWVTAGKFFDRVTFATGHSMDKCSTNNVLIERHVFDRVPSFDEGLELTGADDTHFFMRVNQTGHKIVWAADAFVYEAISASRANVRWLLQRGYRLGNSWSLCERSLSPGFGVRVVRFLKAVGWMAKGFALGLAAIVQGKTAMVWALREICYGAGQLSGLAGHKYQEYRSAGADSAERLAGLRQQA